MSYKGQVLRGEKWYHLDRDTKDENKLADIKVYLESVEKVKKEREEKKTKSMRKK